MSYLSNPYEYSGGKFMTQRTLNAIRKIGHHRDEQDGYLQALTVGAMSIRGVMR